MMFDYLRFKYKIQYEKIFVLFYLIIFSGLALAINTTVIPGSILKTTSGKQGAPASLQVANGKIFQVTDNFLRTYSLQNGNSLAVLPLQFNVSETIKALLGNPESVSENGQYIAYTNDYGSTSILNTKNGNVAEIANCKNSSNKNIHIAFTKNSKNISITCKDERITLASYSISKGDWESQEISKFDLAIKSSIGGYDDFYYLSNNAILMCSDELCGKIIFDQSISCEDSSNVLFETISKNHWIVSCGIKLFSIKAGGLSNIAAVTQLSNLPWSARRLYCPADNCLDALGDGAELFVVYGDKSHPENLNNKYPLSFGKITKTVFDVNHKINLKITFSKVIELDKKSKTVKGKDFFENRAAPILLLNNSVLRPQIWDKSPKVFNQNSFKNYFDFEEPKYPSIPVGYVNINNVGRFINTTNGLLIDENGLNLGKLEFPSINRILDIKTLDDLTVGLVI
jgi:hypothetical protein